ncbi:TMV resistance protein N-like [Senna tora]|uniref:TMV resistance protein N-like n=1 Tax=Senna tora TaxID=362788 RepID=A0A834XCN4_9FABA|nr:TMV resistance protein N-like [Senna tora]
MEGNSRPDSDDSPLALDWDESRAERKGLNIVEVSQNLFIFTFDREEDCDRVLREGPWAVLGHLLSVKSWSPELALPDVSFDYCSFWAQFHGLPLEGFSAKNVVKLGKLVGKPVAMEDPIENDKVVRSFVRAKMCYQCGRVGHDFKFCTEERARSLVCPSKDRYGPWLGAAPVKAIHRILEIDERGNLKEDQSFHDSEHEVNEEDEVREWKGRDEGAEIEMQDVWASDAKPISLQSDHKKKAFLNFEDCGDSAGKKSSFDSPNVPPLEAEQAGNYLALVPAPQKTYEAKLSRSLQKVNLKRKASVDLSPEKFKRTKARGSSARELLVHPIFSIGVSPEKNRRFKVSPGKRKKKVGRNAKVLSDVLVDVLVSDGMVGIDIVSSMDGSVSDGMGGWPATAPMAP